MQLRTCVRSFSLNTLPRALGDGELRLISCTSLIALLSPSCPGAAALKTTGLLSSCSANSGAASPDRGRAGGAVHTRVSHPGKTLRSGSAASWPHHFSTGQGRRQTTTSCPLLGHQHRGTSVSLHPGVGEAPKPPSPWADGDGDLARQQPGNHSLVCCGPQRAHAVGHVAVTVSGSLRVNLRCIKHGRQKSCMGGLCSQLQKDVGGRRRTICMKTSFSTGPR